MTDEGVTSTPRPSASSSEMASRSTGLAMRRTRLSADRTLLSVIRTALSLVSFGITISLIFEKLTEGKVVQGDSVAENRFGIALVLVGILMLVFGVLSHGRLMLALRRERGQLAEDGLIHDESPITISPTLIAAVTLLGISVVAIISMVFHIGLF